MLELYHHGSSVCAAKVRLSLEEKGLSWNGHYIDILAGEQFTDSYRALNPAAVVPTLVHDELVVSESSIICEYLEDVFSSPSLRPLSFEERNRQRHWSRRVDQSLHPVCAELTFAASHRFNILNLGDQQAERFLAATPGKANQSSWHHRKKEIVRLGFDAPGISDSVRLYDEFLHDMETQLEKTPWLAGPDVSLADFAMVPYVMRLEMLGMERIWARGRRPHVENWLRRIKDRPSFEQAVWKWMPAKLVIDLRTNGEKSWHEVAKILDIEVCES